MQSREDKMKEYMLLALRKIEGVRISEFKKRFVDNPIYLYREELNKLVTQELIEIEDDNIKLTNKGIDLANLVWEEFVQNLIIQIRILQVEQIEGYNNIYDANSICINAKTFCKLQEQSKYYYNLLFVRKRVYKDKMKKRIKKLAIRIDNC